MKTATGVKNTNPDPEIVLRDMMSLREFAGVPVLILDGDLLPRNEAQREQYILDQISRRTFAAPDTARSLKSIFEKCRPYFSKGMTAEFQSNGYLMPVIMHDSDTSIFAYKSTDNSYIPPRSTIITAPSAHIDIGRYLDRKDCPRFDDLISLFRVIAIIHELAHVAGAGEPHADHTALLSLRRLFGEAAIPAIRLHADMRVVNTMNAIRNYLPRVRADTLSLYGWPMVTVNDAVADMSQNEVPDLSAEGIIFASRFKRYDHNMPKLNDLYGMVDKAAFLKNGITIADTADFAQTLQRTIAVNSDDLQLNAIGKRYALAADRLASGQNAYMNNVAPRGPNQPYRMSNLSLV